MPLTDEIIITDEFNDSRGRLRNYHAYDPLLDEAIRSEKHVDLRGFRSAENWSAGVVGTLAQSNNWKGLTVTLSHGTNLVESVYEPVDLLTGFDDDAVLSIALPNFPFEALELDDSYVELTSNPNGDFEVGPTAAVPLEDSDLLLFEGNCEFRVPRSAFEDIDLSEVYGVRLRMVVDSATATSQQAELEPDTLRVHQLHLNAATTITEIRAYLDGQGSGAGDTKVKAVIYDESNALVATSSEVTVVDNAPPDVFVFPVSAALSPGEYYLGIVSNIPTNGQQGVARKTPGIVARWKMDDPVDATNATDDVGEFHLLRNSAATQPIFGQPPLVGPGNAVLFSNAANSRWVIPADAAFAVTTFSFEAWLRLDGTAANYAIVSLGNTTNVRGLYMWVNGPSRNIGMRCNYAGSRTDVIGNAAVTIGAPFHVVGTYDGTTMRLYVNGVEVANAASAYVPPLTTDRFYVGYVGSAGSSWEGIMDEVAFYNRALTAGEVSDHYTGTYRAGKRARLYGDDFATPKTNLVSNPRVKDNGTGWEIGSAAVYTDLGSSTRALLPDGSGDYGLRGYGQHDATTTNGAVSANTNTPITAYGVPVRSGVQYTLSADILVVDPPATNGFRHQIIWYDANGVNLGNAGSISGYTALPVGRTRTNLVATAPSNAAYARLYTQALTTTSNDIIDFYVTKWRFTEDISASGALYDDGSSPGWIWDGAADASLSRGPQGAVNLMPNPTGNGGNLYGWNVRSSGTLEAITDPPVPLPNGASHCFKMTRKSDGTGINTVYIATGVNGRVPVTPGKTYSYGCRILRGFDDGSTQNLNIYRIWYAADLSTIVAGYVAVNPSSTTEWVQHATTEVAPPGAALLYLRPSGGLIPEGQSTYISCVQVNEGDTLLPYHDGDMPNCDWLGTPAQSPSIKWQVPQIASSYSSVPSTLGLPVGADLPYGASLTLQPVGDLTVSGMRLLPDDWERPNISFNTASGRLMATPTLDGSPSAPTSYDLPPIFRAAEPAGSLNDPRPIDGELAFVFDTGSMTAEQSFDIYMREVPWDIMTQLDLNQYTQDQLNNWNVDASIDRVLLGTNYVKNPRAEVDTSNVTLRDYNSDFNDETLTREICDWHPGASHCFRISGTNSVISARALGAQFYDTGTSGMPVIPGQTIWVSTYVKTIDPSPTRGWRWRADFYDAAGALVGATLYSTEYADEGLVNARLSKDFVVPAGAAYGCFAFQVIAGSDHRVTAEFTSVLIHAGDTLLDYFDGTVNPGSGYTSRWTGTPHASTSQLFSTSEARTLEGVRQPKIGMADYRSRTQGDLNGLPLSILNGVSQYDLRRMVDDDTTAYIKFGFAWSTAETAIAIQDQDGRGFSTTQSALEPNKTYLYIASLRDYTARGRLYLLSTLKGMLQSELNLLTQGELENLNRGVEVTQPALVYDTGKLADQSVYKRRKGRMGWHANLVDGDAFVDSVRTRGLNFAEIRTRPLLSDTPVVGGQLFVPHSSAIQMFAGFSPTTQTPAIHVTRDKDRSTSGESWKVVDYGQEAKHGVVSNLMVFTNFEESEVTFDLYYPSSGPGIEAYLQSAGGLRIPLVMPRVVRDQWHRYQIPTRFANEVQTGTYRLVLIQPEASRTTWWVDNVEVTERTVAWEACANEPDPWAPLEPREYSSGVNIAKDPNFTQPELWTINSSTLVNQVWSSDVVSFNSRSLYPKAAQFVPNYGGNYRFKIDLEVISATADVVVMYIWRKKNNTDISDGAIILPSPTPGRYVLEEDWFFDPYELKVYDVDRLAVGMLTSNTFNIKLNEVQVISLDQDPYVHWTPFKDTVNTTNGGILFDKRGTSLKVRGRALRQNAWVGGPIRIEPKYAELGRLVADIAPDEVAPPDLRPFTGTLLPNSDTDSSGWAASGAASVIAAITDSNNATYAFADVNGSALKLGFPAYFGRDVKRVVASYVGAHDVQNNVLLELLHGDNVLEATLQQSITYYPTTPFTESDMQMLKMRITKQSGGGFARVREVSLDWTAVGAPPG